VRPRNAGRGKAIAAAAGAAVVVGAIGGALTDISPWYLSLAMPSWKPPDWAFGPIWTAILALAAAAGYTAWRTEHTLAGQRRIFALFALNGSFNVIWSLLFFKLQRPDMALWEVGGLWLSILLLILAFRRSAPLASLMLAPYLIWVSIASALNYQVVEMNGPFS
jgi:tryptophan-rich sensory protein